MNADPGVLRSERHVQVGALIQRNADAIIARWCERVVRENPGAKRLHHQALRDDLPHFLHELGHSMAASQDGETERHRKPAGAHGRQRWEVGWSLHEIVRDYQLLRLVLLEYLDEHLARPLRMREVMALGLALDEAIAASVEAFVHHRDQLLGQLEQERAERERQKQEAEEARLRQRAEELEQVNRNKDEFLAVLGHELRNPLAPIQNALHVLKRKRDGETVEWAGALLERQIRQLTRLVDDLLDASRLGQGKMRLQTRRIDLVPLVRAAVEDYRPQLEAAGLTLKVDAPATPVPVEADATRLTQAVGNLLANAAKFTDAGGTVAVAVRHDPASGRAEVEVRDTGIGLDPALAPRLFDVFVQADSGPGRNRGGLGLGLALVRGIVALHGGEVRAASDGPGTGSAFTFWLPATGAGPSSPPEPTSD
jgi:signal transduction histidine kinase